MSTMRDMVKAGYVVGNGTRWYASHSGLKDTPFPLEIHVIENQCRILTMPYGEYTPVELLRFDSVESLLSYLEDNGIHKQSLPPMFQWD